MILLKNKIIILSDFIRSTLSLTIISMIARNRIMMVINLRWCDIGNDGGFDGDRDNIDDGDDDEKYGNSSDDGEGVTNGGADDGVDEVGDMNNNGGNNNINGDGGEGKVIMEVMWMVVVVTVKMLVVMIIILLMVRVKLQTGNVDGGGDDTINVNGVDDDVAVDANGNNDPGCCDGKRKIDCSEDTAGDDGNSNGDVYAADDSCIDNEGNGSDADGGSSDQSYNPMMMLKMMVELLMMINVMIIVVTMIKLIIIIKMMI